VTAALTLANAEDLPRLLPMIAANHAEAGIDQSDDARRDAVTPLLDSSPHGAVWLIGPRRAPVGYIAMSFGWSIGLGGMNGTLDEFFIREGVRGRGMGTEVLSMLLPQLSQAGLVAMSLTVAPQNAQAQRLYERAGFRLRDGLALMRWRR